MNTLLNLKQKNETVKLIMGALHKSVKRGIICCMGDIDKLPENLLAINSIPHSWLFEHVSLICYHGSAGTTAFKNNCRLS